jgi:hypothetical protein
MLDNLLKPALAVSRCYLLAFVLLYSFKFKQCLLNVQMLPTDAVGRDGLKSTLRFLTGGLLCEWKNAMCFSAKGWAGWKWPLYSREKSFVNSKINKISL